MKTLSDEDDKKSIVMEATIIQEDLFTIRSLKQTWNKIRKELRELNARDVIDWLDWSITVDRSIEEIVDEVKAGTYEPSNVTTYESSKSKGSFRVISILNVRDALVYRHICDKALLLALPKKVKGAYFSRRHSPTPVGKSFDINEDPSGIFMSIWMRYQEYRTRTLLSGIYKYLVVTDISNYFESIQHELLFEYLTPLGLPREAIGLLGKLLDAFRPWAGHSPRPRVGIPVDELDCSRQLAHIFLFEHDKRITDKFGEENYVRWMDDQNVGVESKTDARKVVNYFTRSLSQQRLTINSGKTKFLNPDELTTHFLLEENDKITKWEDSFKKDNYRVTETNRESFLAIWEDIKNCNKDGNWDKVLKRCYGICTRLNINILELSSLENLIEYPQLSERIFIYLAKRNRGDQLFQLFQDYLNTQECLFEEIELYFFESSLLLDCDNSLERKFIDFSTQYIYGEVFGQTERPLGRAAAIISLFWFGETYENIYKIFENINARIFPKEVCRAWLTVLTTLNPEYFNLATSKLFGHRSDDVARIVHFLNDLLNGNVSKLPQYKNLKPRWPLPGQYYDARAWLTFNLIAHSKNDKLHELMRNDYKIFSKYVYTNQEMRIAEKIRELLDISFKPKKRED